MAAKVGWRAVRPPPDQRSADCTNADDCETPREKPARNSHSVRPKVSVAIARLRPALAVNILRRHEDPLRLSRDSVPNDHVYGQKSSRAHGLVQIRVVAISVANSRNVDRSILLVGVTGYGSRVELMVW